jgi:hypothetical protein
VGRGGWREFNEKNPHIWPELLAKHPDLKSLTNERCKLLLAGVAKKNKETGLHELNDEHIATGGKLVKD